MEVCDVLTPTGAMIHVKNSGEAHLRSVISSLKALRQPSVFSWTQSFAAKRERSQVVSIRGCRGNQR